MTIRAYQPSDFPIVEQWAKARNMVLIPQLLSKNGFLVEDEDGPIAVAWCYLTFDCPLAYVDHLFTRPKTSLKKGLAAWRLIWRTIQAFLLNLRDCNGNALSYKIVRVFTCPELSRFLKSDGWKVSAKTVQQAIYAIP